MGGVKFSECVYYAYQTFGDNKLVNYLCSTFKTPYVVKYWRGEILVNVRLPTGKSPLLYIQNISKVNYGLAN